ASTDFPATAGGAQPDFAPPSPGSSAGFVVRIGAELTGDAPTPTPTAIPTTASTPTTTSTPTIASTPTATAPPAPCVGDCSGEHRVTVDDLIKGVNIALGNVAIDVCAAFDLNGDGRVEVNELISAVASALNGCA